MTGWEVLPVVPSHLRLPDDPALWVDGYDPQPVESQEAARAVAARAIAHPEVTYVEIYRDGEVVEVVDNPSYVETRACETCEAISSGFGPSHEGSPRCESGSIASGGTHEHCTCDTCF